MRMIPYWILYNLSSTASNLDFEVTFVLLLGQFCAALVGVSVVQLLRARLGA